MGFEPVTVSSEKYRNTWEYCFLIHWLLLSRAIDVGLKCRFCRKNINTSNFLIRIYSVHFAVCSWNKDHHNQFQIMKGSWSMPSLWPCWAARSSQSISNYERKLVHAILMIMLSSKIITINFKIWKEDNHDDHWKHGDHQNHDDHYVVLNQRELFKQSVAHL